MTNLTHPILNNGSRVAVIGGGPAGCFFSYFLLDMAERVGLKLQVDIFEPRDFNVPGPQGCNMCAGVLHESLVQSLATEGINLPTTVVQRGLDSSVLHMDVGDIRIETPRQEKRIATTFRGAGPRDSRGNREGLDGHLLELAVRKGANRIDERIDGVAWASDPEEPNPHPRRLFIKARGGAPQTYDLVAVAAGVNSALLKTFQTLGFGYEPPRTTKCRVREYYLGEEAVTRYIGPAMHAFMLNIPRLDFGAFVPKGDYVSLALLGDNVDDDMMRQFVNHPAVKQCLPPGFSIEEFVCSCAPRINVQGSPRTSGDRIVFIGDAGVTRLYKDGIGSAYRAAKVAASTVIFEGVSARDFRRHYVPFSQMVWRDNSIGKLIFAIVRQIQRMQFARRAILRMVAAEQQGHASALTGMSMVLWDMFTGSASYRDIFLRTIHPVFWTRLLWNSVVSLPTHRQRDITKSETGRWGAESVSDQGKQNKEDEVPFGALGKPYADGEVIFHQGDRGNGMYVIQEGRVEILEELDGKQVQLAVRDKGEFFGEMSIFERKVRSATVRALGKARVLSIDETTLLARIHQDPSLAYRMVRTMSHRIRALSEEVARLKHSGQNL